MKKRLCFLILISFLSAPRAMAQDDDFPPTDDPPVPAAPVDFYIPALLIAGVLYAVRVVKAKKETNQVS